MVDTISISDRMSSASSITLGPPPPSTTISTIALQCGQTRIVVALLQSRDSLTLRVLEMSPNLAALGRNEEDAKEMLTTHEGVLEKLRNKQSPVEELLRQADTLVSNQNPDIYIAMADCLGNAWRDLNSKLELRREILQICSEFQKHRQSCLAYFVKLNPNKKEVLMTYRLAVDEGRNLIEKLREAGKEKPEEASYSISLVNAWLDELQQSRIQWLATLKKQIKQDKDAEINKEFEAELRQIEEVLKKNPDLDELRNQLLKLYSNIEKSDLSSGKKSVLQRQIYNLIEKISIKMEVDAEITTFIKTFIRLDEVTFKKRYEDKLQMLTNFDPEHTNANILRNRLSIRKSYEDMLERPLDFSDEEVKRTLGQDPELDISTALEKVKDARKMLEQSVWKEYESQVRKLQEETKDAIIKTDLKKLKQLSEHTSANLLQIQGIETPDEEKRTLIEQIEIIQETITTTISKLLIITEFIETKTVLDDEGFRETYLQKLDDLKSLSPEADSKNEITSLINKRIEIRTNYEKMLENSNNHSEAEIVRTLNQDPKLDTKSAISKIFQRRQEKVREAEEKEEARRQEELRQQKEEDERRQNELNEQARALEDQVLRQNEIEAELQRQRQLQAEEDERKRLEETQRQAALAAELQIQKQITDELENQRQLEADIIREKQLVQLELQAQAERENQKKVEEEYLKRRLLEAELDKQRQIEEDLTRQREIDAELQRQKAIEEAEREAALEAELQAQRQITEELERQRQLETNAQREKHLMLENQQLESARQKQKQIEIEFQRQQELENELKRQKQLEDEIERQRQIEAETQRKRQSEEFQRQQQLETELHRQKLITDELEKQRQAEEERQLQRQIEAELNRQEAIAAEIRKQEAKAKERQRQEAIEQERQRQEAFERQRQEAIELENRRQEAIALERQRQEAIEAERQRQEAIEAERQRQEAIEAERQRQEAIEAQIQTQKQLTEAEMRRKYELDQPLHIQVEPEMQAQTEIYEGTYQFQHEYQSQQQIESEEFRSSTKLEVQKLNDLFRTLDFPLPENLETARNDLGDFEKFECIVDKMQNPPPELIEKMYEKKENIIRCLRLYELYERIDRVIYIKEIEKLELELFGTDHLSGQIREANQPSTSFQTQANSVPQEIKYPTEYGENYVMSLSDTEVQTIFEQSTMETQTLDYGTPLTNSQTQTDGQPQKSEPVVLVMQEPAKILSTSQTQTSELPSYMPVPVRSFYTAGTEEQLAAICKPELRTSEAQTGNDMVSSSNSIVPQQSKIEPVILREQEPAKLLSSSETQTHQEPVEQRAESRQQLYIHETVEETVEECSRVEPIVPLIEAGSRSSSVDKTTAADKRLSDIETQTHEPSPQLLRNSESQTKLSDFVDANDKIFVDESKSSSKFQSSSAQAEFITGQNQESGHRPKVSERVQALDSQIKRELQNEVQGTGQTLNSGMPGNRINQLKETFSGESCESKTTRLPSDPAALGITSSVSTYRQVFESFDGYEVTQRSENENVFNKGPSVISPNIQRRNEEIQQFIEQNRNQEVRPLELISFSEEPRKHPSEIPIGKAVSNYRKLFENIASDNSTDREKVSSHESLSQKSELNVSTTDVEFQSAESARASSTESTAYASSDFQPKKTEVPLRRRSVSDYKSYFDSLEASDQRSRTPVSEPVYRIREVRSASSYDSSSKKYQSSYSEQISSQGYPSPGFDSPISPSLSEQDEPRPRSGFESLHERFRPRFRPGSGMSRFDTPQPSKFVPAKFAESDYESDFESFKIEPVWRPPGSRPHSAVEFRTISPAVAAPRDRDTIQTSQMSAFTSVQTFSPPGQMKPIPPPKPILKKPIAIIRDQEQRSGVKAKPIPPPKPLKCFSPVSSTVAGIGKKSPPTTFTEQVTFDLEEPISDSLLRQTQLTSTLTKTEECKFILRPIKSPSSGPEDSDEDLQVRKSPLNYFVSVTSPPITTTTAVRKQPESASPAGLCSESNTFSKTTFQEEKILHSFEQSSSVESLNNSSTVTRTDSPFKFRTSISILPGVEKPNVRPKSEELMQSIRTTYSFGSERPKSSEFISETRLVEGDREQASSTKPETPDPRPPSREFVHRINIDK